MPKEEPATQMSKIEQKLGKKWYGTMLQVGQIFQLHGQFVLSLGFRGYAALVWKVYSFDLPDGKLGFSMKVPFA